MAAPPVFGRIDKPQDLNLDPLTFTLVGYHTNGTGEVTDIEESFAVSPIQPFSAMVELMGVIASTGGQVQLNQASEVVLKSLVSDAERERFAACLDADGVYYDSSAIFGAMNWLIETYAERPTRRPTGAASGPGPVSRRSRAAGTGRGGATSAASTRR